MHHALNGRPFLDRSSELFFELALEGLLGRLPRFHFSAGELPLERRGVVAAPLSNQQPPVTALNHRCNDGSHASRHLRNGLAGSSLSRAGRFGISSHPPLALAALLSFRTFQSSFAPLISGGPRVVHKSSPVTLTRRILNSSNSLQAPTSDAFFGSA